MLEKKTIFWWANTRAAKNLFKHPGGLSPGGEVFKNHPPGVFIKTPLLVAAGGAPKKKFFFLGRRVLPQHTFIYSGSSMGTGGFVRPSVFFLIIILYI